MSNPADPSNQANGLDVAETQAVSTPNGTVWVVPGSNGACVIVVNPVQPNAAVDAVCGTVPGVNTSGLGGRIGDGHTGVVTFYGIEPDSVADVSAADVASHTSKVARVSRNAYILRGPELGHRLLTRRR
jgi:hypothetical protein